MSRKTILVSESRNYRVKTVAEARTITLAWLGEIQLSRVMNLGLPEVDDRYHIWRVPLCDHVSKQKIGEVVIDAYTTEIDPLKTTRPEMLEARILKKSEHHVLKEKHTESEYTQPALRNTIGLGDCVQLIEEMPSNCVDLVFTSPPYFNARPEYAEYEQYEEYLHKMRQVINRCNRVIKEGRFFVINCAPVLIRRSQRNESSKRIAVPFDLHRLLIEEGYDFIDDIIWVKPEGAGWATGRGRRFAADRNPLQYKAVPVTEYVLVYRKRTNRLIDWHIRNHPNKGIVKESKIKDPYEKTNIWRIQPATNSGHPAAFPLELAKKVITYYSFVDDVIMDPFAGSGTVGHAASILGRRFVLYEINPEFIGLIKGKLRSWLGRASEDVMIINSSPVAAPEYLF